MPSVLIIDKLILSSERILPKDYGRKGSAAKRKSVVLGIKGLGGKTNYLAVNRQSKNNSDSNSDSAETTCNKFGTYI
jgi:hypothetical protein